MPSWLTAFVPPCCGFAKATALRAAVTPMNDAVIKALFDALVRKAGGVDAAAAVFGARFGADQKGTVSKIVAGQLRVPLIGAVALEDAVGEYPITVAMGERLGLKAMAGGDLAEMAAQSVETIAAAHAQMIRALAAVSDGGAEITPREAAQISAAMRRAKMLADQIIYQLEQGAA